MLEPAGECAAGQGRGSMPVRGNRTTNSLPPVGRFRTSSIAPVPIGDPAHHGEAEAGTVRIRGARPRFVDLGRCDFEPTSRRCPHVRALVRTDGPANACDVSARQAGNYRCPGRSGFVVRFETVRARGTGCRVRHGRRALRHGNARSIARRYRVNHASGSVDGVSPEDVAWAGLSAGA